MRVVVCVKQIPDAAGHRFQLEPESLRLDRPGDVVLDPIDAVGIEVALGIVERARGGEVALVSMGPERCVEAVRRGLAMGAARATVVTDPALRGADAVTTARVLAAAVRRQGHDIVITGGESGDGPMGTVAARVAALLDLPALTFATEIAWDGGWLRARRRLHWGDELVEARPPALISVTATSARPRRPSLRGVLAAGRMPVQHLDLAALGLDGIAPGTARVSPVAAEPTPDRPGTAELHDDDDHTGRRLADLIVARLPREPLGPRHRRLRVVGRVPSAAGGRSLNEAPIVLAGGASLGAAGFALLDEVASRLGGAVAASRGAVDAGWASPSALVGQSGRTVSPEVYIAFGISGALQHVCGMRGSKFVIAVNRDPAAPILRVADQGVVGDARTVLEKLLFELRARGPRHRAAAGRPPDLRPNSG